MREKKSGFSFCVIINTVLNRFCPTGATAIITYETSSTKQGQISCRARWRRGACIGKC